MTNNNENNKPKYSKAQQDALEATKAFYTQMREAAKNKQTIKMDKTEDDLDKTFVQSSCPHNKCDGSGYFKVKENNSTYSVFCDCYKDEVLKRKLKKSQIQSSFWDSTIEKLSQIEDKIDVTLLKPLEKPLEIKVDGRKKVQDPETPDEFIKRHYEKKQYPYSIQVFAQGYCKKVLELLSKKPRKETINLLLLGDPGKGKTYFASAIAREFLNNDKTVYFSRLRSLLDMAYDKKEEVMKIVKYTDLLILDELGQEYHTDSQWALKLIQDIIKERQETGLPTICTTNCYPNELEQYYQASLMSTFNGKFVISVFHGDYDLRSLEARNMYDNVDFLKF